MPKPNPDEIRELLKNGYNPFAILFTWDYPADEVATLKMYNLHLKLDKKGIRLGEGWYLTGNRTMIVIGYAKSNVVLQELCLSVTYNTPIRADLYHAIDIHDLASVIPKGSETKHDNITI